MNEEELRQQIRDEEHLKLLSLGYKVTAGMTALFSLFGLFYVFMGALVSVAPMESNLPYGTTPTAEPAFFGWFFVAIGVAFIAIGLGLAALEWTAAARLTERRSVLLCQVAAAILCLQVPYGTLLGVLTFNVLSRPSVRQQFSS